MIMKSDFEKKGLNCFSSIKSKDHCFLPKKHCAVAFFYYVNIAVIAKMFWEWEKNSLKI